MTLLSDGLQGTKSTLRITLEPFTVEQVQEFMQQMLEGTTVSRESAAQIAERTGGLPLYVEQVRLQQVGLLCSLLCKHC